MAKNEWRGRWAVEGSGIFPFDMLRYDTCWPADSESAAKLGGTVRRKVVLFGAFGGPTVARWASFGWMVKEWGR